jgi:hypothetical protein
MGTDIHEIALNIGESVFFAPLHSALTTDLPMCELFAPNFFSSMEFFASSFINRLLVLNNWGQFTRLVNPILDGLFLPVHSGEKIKDILPESGE